MALMGEVILLGISLFRSAGRWSWFAARRLSCFVAFLNFKLNNLKLKSNIPRNSIFVDCCYRVLRKAIFVIFW